MVDACVYRGHFPCLGYGCLAIPLYRLRNAHVSCVSVNNGDHYKKDNR